MKNKKLLMISLLAFALFTFSCVTKVYKEQTSNEIKAEVKESFRIVNNETELGDAIRDRDTTISVQTNFSTSRTYEINYSLTINPASQLNSIFYDGTGSLFIINSGGHLTVDSMVLGSNRAGNRVVSINNGGHLSFKRGSIIDCSPTSQNGIGIYIGNGGTAHMYSSWILKAGTGIYVANGGNLVFESPDRAGGTDDISTCGNAIYYENLSGNVYFNQSGIRIGPRGDNGGNTNGVVIAGGSGTLHISAGNYYQNTNGIVVNSGTVNISGGNINGNTNGVVVNSATVNISGSNIYSNTSGVVANAGTTNIGGGSIYSNSSWGVLVQGGTVNQTGGSIYSNTKGVGIDNNANSKFIKTNGNISGNSQYSIYHNNGNDGSCRVTGGTTSGYIYLAQDNNYVNTYSSYPGLAVQPSTYWLGRKLVKTDSNAIAKSEVNNVTLAPSGDWYKYAKPQDDQHIVVWKDGHVTVNHINRYTSELLAQDKLAGSIDTAWTSSARSISGYKFFSAPNPSSGTYSTTDVEITYEYLKLFNVVTRYVDENYGTVLLTETKPWGQGETYSTELKEIPDYGYTRNSGNLSGIIGTENVEVTYYYRRVSEGVDVKYIDQVTGEEIAEKVTRLGLEKNPYTTYAKEIEGYELVKTPENANGDMTVEKITVTYEYRKNSYVTTNYIDENTGLMLSQQQVNKYKQGDAYTTEEAAVEGYTRTRIETQVAGAVTGTEANGEVVRDNITVNYYYKKNTNVTVKYVDMLDGNKEIADKVVINGLQNDDYETTKKDIPGYIFVETSGIVNGKMKYNPSEVVYKYKKASSVITRHIDANTNEPIIEDVVRVCKQGEKFEAYPQNLEGYIIVEEPETKTGVMGREDITKVFKYKRISNGLVVKYVDILSGDVLEQVTYEGNENDTIELQERTFLGYVIYRRPNIESIKLGVEAEEVVYYYKKEIEANLIGIDQETGDKIYEGIVSGIEGEPYTTIPRIVEGYEVVRTPENNDGIFTREDINIIYEYRKTARDVIVIYMNAETGEELESYRISGTEGDSYQAQRREFENYELVRVEGPEVGVLSREEKVVTYYYERKTGSVSIIYEDEEGKQVLTEVIKGKVGDPYEVEIKEVEGYKVVEVIGEPTGSYDTKTKEIRVRLEKIEEEPKKQGTIIIKFVDEKGNKIKEDYVEYGEIGVLFNYELPTIEGYKVIGNNMVKAKFVEGKLVFEIKYEKIEGNVEVVEKEQEKDVETGDMNIAMLSIIAIISVFGLVKVANKRMN